MHNVEFVLVATFVVRKNRPIQNCKICFALDVIAAAHDRRPTQTNFVGETVRRWIDERVRARRRRR